MRELWLFLRTRKKWWLAPILLTVLLLGVIMIVGQVSGAGPFVYTLF